MWRRCIFLDLGKRSFCAFLSTNSETTTLAPRHGRRDERVRRPPGGAPASCHRSRVRAPVFFVARLRPFLFVARARQDTPIPRAPRVTRSRTALRATR
jgi:hypothetical protein